MGEEDKRAAAAAARGIRCAITFLSQCASRRRTYMRVYTRLDRQDIARVVSCVNSAGVHMCIGYRGEVRRPRRRRHGVADRRAAGDRAARLRRVLRQVPRRLLGLHRADSQ